MRPFKLKKFLLKAVEWSNMDTEKPMVQTDWQWGERMISTLDDMIQAADLATGSIPQINGQQNFWMIRSTDGIFYSEYVEKGFIGIGWNVLTEDVLNQYEEKAYYEELLKSHKYTDKASGAVLSKCRRFVNEIQCGDIGIIVGKTEVAFALIGKYFELNTEETTPEYELEINSQIEAGKYPGDSCPYRKRREITVISRTELDHVPLPIYKCLLSNRHSLSSMSKYADSILSCCYDLCYYENRLILKYHVKQEKDINPVDFSQFVLSVAELVAEDDRQLVGKYNLNSEGDVVLFLANNGQSAVDFLKNYMVPILLASFIMFGGKGFGFEFPSMIDKMKGIVTDFIFRKENRRLKAAEVQKAEAEARGAAARAEQAEIETKLKRLELERERARGRAEVLVDNLARVSVPLQIVPPDSKILNLAELYEVPKKDKT